MPMLEDLSVSVRLMNSVKEKMMLNTIDKRSVKRVADLEGMPKGPTISRKNGKLGREVSANINIETNEKGDGIVIDIKPGTRDESVHIPVILSQAGLHDVVYNTFIIGEGLMSLLWRMRDSLQKLDHESEGHSGIHRALTSRPAQRSHMLKSILPLARAATHLKSNHKGVHGGKCPGTDGTDPDRGVDEAKRVNEATIGAGSVLLITERVMTERSVCRIQKWKSPWTEKTAKPILFPVSVIKGSSSQDFYVNLTAKAKCYGHIECDAIIMDNGINQIYRRFKATASDAELTREASIGKIANSQLSKAHEFRP